jgi:hypothetical protein
MSNKRLIGTLKYIDDRQSLYIVIFFWKTKIQVMILALKRQKKIVLKIYLTVNEVFQKLVIDFSEVLNPEMSRVLSGENGESMHANVSSIINWKLSMEPQTRKFYIRNSQEAELMGCEGTELDDNLVRKEKNKLFKMSNFGAHNVSRTSVSDSTVNEPSKSKLE